MSLIRTSAFDLHRGRVEGMIAEGKSFERLERVIDRAALPPEQRDALWLVAWALERRRASYPGRERRAARPVERLVPIEGGI